MKFSVAYLCTPQRKQAAARAAKEPIAEVKLVGAQGLTIYDVFYHFESEGAPNWKSILVKTAPNVHREIYHGQPTQADARELPSVIVRVGTDSLLNSRCFGGGNKGMYEDDYYWFGKTGPTLMDFEPIFAAGQGVLPEGLSIWRGGDSNSPETLPSMKFSLGVWSRNDTLCCRPGIVEVMFNLDRGHVIVTKAQYDPKQKN